MPLHLLFYFVLLGQVLLISFYFPRRVLSLMRFVADAYPPRSYPKLYPKPIAYYEKAQRRYKLMNHVALLVGLGLVVVGVTSPGEEMLNWDSDSVLTLYVALQFSPLIIAATSGFIYFSPKRRLDSGTTRRAGLHRRRLFDFLSPAALSAAIAVYVAFVLLVVYVRQLGYPWFGGYANVVVVTAINLFFAAIIFRYLYGRKEDPYQAYEDRLRGIELNVKILVLTSVVVTSFIAIAIILRALDLEDLIPVSQSLLFQLTALIGLRAFRIDRVDFEVYREGPCVS